VFHVKHIPDYREALVDCRAIGIEHTPSDHEKLERYASILDIESRKTNLVGPAEMTRLWRRHILESMSYSLMLIRDRRVVDVGSGAGFPGLILAIMGFELLLLEPRRMRNAFLVDTAASLGLESVVTTRSRLQTGPSFPPETQFVARSVLKPEILYEYMRVVCEGSFSCTRRYGEENNIPEGATRLELPSPPLDRPGFLVQYRHPD
jgi:16S rRNA G527 N7-methylase RsmG